MEVSVSFRHGDSDPKLKQYVVDKIESALGERPVKIISVTAVVDNQKKNRWVVEVIVNIKGHDFESVEEAYSPQEAIDKAVDKVETQLSKHLDKIHDHHKRK